MIRRMTIALLCALTAALALASTAFAGATQSVVYCGDPLDSPNCTSAGNYDWLTQRSILVERSLNSTGQYVWTGQVNYGHGFLAGNQPIAGSIPPEGDRQVLTSYMDPTGDLADHLNGLAYDPASNTLFIADTDLGRIVAYNRGSFDALGNSPGAYPVDYSRGFAAGGASGPGGISFNPVTGELIVTSPGNWSLLRYSFTPGTRVGTPPAGGPTVGPGESFGSADWSDEGKSPVDVVSDPTDGHMFVAMDTLDEIWEYDETYDHVNTISTGQAGVADTVQAVALDPDARLLYIAKEETIEVVSLSTGAKLGNLDFGFDASGLEVIEDIDVDPIAHALYVVTSETAATGASEAPVAGYALDPPPSCNLQTPTMLPGDSRTITPNCTDVDGGTIEYSVVGSATGGSAVSLEDRSALSYTAPAQVGNYTIPFRARSMNGRTTTINQPVSVAVPAPAPNLTPVVRKTANLSLDSGVVQIKLPGTDIWIPLTEATLIPVGTIIDARKGKAHLTFANADGTLQDGIFWEGIFQVSQGSGNKPLVTLKLRDDLAGKANAAIRSAIATSAGFEAFISRKRGKKKNGLWGDAKGKYKTSGKGGSATVRGTRWYVANYEQGSLFKVARGSVTIDPIRGKNFVLKSGKQFFIFYKKNP
jgi:hypothetical protein